MNDERTGKCLRQVEHNDIRGHVMWYRCHITCAGCQVFKTYKQKAYMLRFHLFILNLFAKNIVPPLCKVERGIRPLALTHTPLQPVHVIYMPCVILGDIKRFWLSCLIGPFCFSSSKMFLSCLTFRSVDFQHT